MKIHNLNGRTLGGYTTFGGVWEKGEVTKPEFLLFNQEGKEIPVQSRPMAYWSDGSIKWSSHTADSSAMGEYAQLFADAGLEKEPDSSFLQGIKIENNGQWYCIDNGKLTFKVPVLEIMQHEKQEGIPCLAKDVKLQDSIISERIYPVFELENRITEQNCRISKVTSYEGQVFSVELEQAGPLQAVFCFKGYYVTGEKCQIPFVIRMFCCWGSEELRFMHTFLYDGEPERDFLKGMGIRFELPMQGRLYDRHVQFGTDGPDFHEFAMMLVGSYPKLPLEILEKQLKGLVVNYEQDSMVQEAAANLPLWQRFCLFQDSAWHYQITKQTYDECCKLSCRQGKRASGVMAVNHEKGGILLGIRDFWKKYPSGLEIEDLGSDCGMATAWFYCPEAEGFDFRHYDKRSYPNTCYEGYEEVDAYTEGIGVTSECSVRFVTQMVTSEELKDFGDRVQKPAVYVGDTEYYHKKKAFGYWGLKIENNAMGIWLEEQLEKAFYFYQREVENRDWYGLFNYGDVMHTYDNLRHCWKYDVGGFAWQNTELVPTYWLGLYFLHTGREDVFTMMEAMSRHCSEVDIYHFGKYKGIGSRHNVRHWGCPCKEPRISMAGHHRFLCYLTGDLRLEDVFDDVKDSDLSMEALRHNKDILPNGEVAVIARSGPDWSSFVSNWMTQYERTLDQDYREKIIKGIDDIAATPYGLASGPDYYYEPRSGHLIYRGEFEDKGNQHLQICMGGPQVWLETADMLEDDRLKELLSKLGAFYHKSKEEKSRLTKGKIKDRPFSWPMFATGIAGFSAMRSGDKELARLVWGILFFDLFTGFGEKGFIPVAYGRKIDGSICEEVVGITTNIIAQWCLNVIMCMEFIPEYLPQTLEECKKMVEQAEVCIKEMK